MKRIIFVTGTDTGVGKTVLTALLLVHLRSQGCNALAMKPFCSGSRADARLLHSLQKECLTLDDVNPFYFDKPLAPAASPKRVPFHHILAKIQSLSAVCDFLLVEGAGGLLAPLGKNYTFRDLIAALPCEVIIVATNRLGVINHILLTIESLQTAKAKKLTIVLMDVKKPDLSSKSNLKMLRERIGKVKVLAVGYLGKWGKNGEKRRKMKESASFLKKTLAQIS